MLPETFDWMPSQYITFRLGVRSPPGKRAVFLVAREELLLLLVRPGAHCGKTFAARPGGAGPGLHAGPQEN